MRVYRAYRVWGIGLIGFRVKKVQSLEGLEGLGLRAFRYKMNSLYFYGLPCRRHRKLQSSKPSWMLRFKA